MSEKAKNDQPRPCRKIAKWGCIFLLVIGCLGLLVIRQIILDFSEGGWMMGPGLADVCMGITGIHSNFKLSGQVIDEQGQPLDLAIVELSSDGPKSCIKEINTHHTTTDTAGGFSFGPTFFEYQGEFFISVSAEGCGPSTSYYIDPVPDDVVIVLQCNTTP